MTGQALTAFGSLIAVIVIALAMFGCVAALTGMPPDPSTSIHTR